MATTKDDLTKMTLTVLDQPNGLSKLTVDVLASNLRMSKTTLYKHFEGMDDLLYASVERLCAETDRELAHLDTSGTPRDTFNAVASLFGSYAERLPAGLMLPASRDRLPAAARMRLANTEERLGERMFRASMGLGASSYVAHGVRSAYEGLICFLRTVPHDERHSHVSELTAVLRAALTA